MKVLEVIKDKKGNKSVTLLSSLNSTENGRNPARGDYRSHVEFLSQDNKSSAKKSKK